MSQTQIPPLCIATALMALVLQLQVKCGWLNDILNTILSCSVATTMCAMMKIHSSKNAIPTVPDVSSYTGFLASCTPSISKYRSSCR